MAQVAIETENSVRQLRDIGGFTLYDTVFVGPNAGNADPGWYNNFQDLALQDRLSFFNGRKANSLAWTNQPGERRDWAFEAQTISMEAFCTYPNLGAQLTQPLDADVYPGLWSQLPQAMSIQIALGDAADIVWQSPLSFVPTSSAPYGTNYAAAPAPSTTMGSMGVPIKKNNTLQILGNLKLPAKSKLDVSCQIAASIKQFLANVNLPPPGQFRIVTAAGATASADIWYGIRINLHGTRAVQLRGARSSA